MQKNVPPTSEPGYSVAVYDSQTGEVLLIHHFGAMPGIELPNSEHLHEMALRHAAHWLKRERGSMQVLKIDASVIERKRVYRVSLPDRRLVENRTAPRK